MRGAEERNAKGDLKQIREINCLHTFDEFASEALPYWIERAVKLERALERACKYFFDCIAEECPPGPVCEKLCGNAKEFVACWKRYFLEKEGGRSQ